MGIPRYQCTDEPSYLPECWKVSYKHHLKLDKTQHKCTDATSNYAVYWMISCTWKWTLATINAQMTVQVAFHWKTFLTYITWKQMHPTALCMLMELEITLQDERCLTNVTCKQMLPSMNTKQQLQMTLPPEWFLKGPIHPKLNSAV